MTTVTNTLGLLLWLAVLFVPLSLLWAYALYDSVRGVWSRRAATDPVSDEIDAASWPVLLLLTGFFGGIAYLVLVFLPRLQKPSERLRARALGTA